MTVGSTLGQGPLSIRSVRFPALACPPSVDGRSAPAPIRAVRPNNPTRQVIAHYSAMKVAGFAAVVVVVSVWLFLDGQSRAWRLPEGRYGSLFPIAVLGAIISWLWLQR